MYSISEGCGLNIEAGAKREPREGSQTEPVIISLKDCLACSGCRTSAEIVMLEKQSLDEFLSHINSDEAVIVSLSPQSRASLASSFDLSPSQIFRKLTTFFKSLGVKAIFDTSCSRDLALIEACNEFIMQYKKLGLASVEENGSTLPMLSSACPVEHQEETVNEASGRAVAEIDSVLTTGAVLDLIQLKSVDSKSLEEAPLDKMLTNVDEEGHLYGVSGSSGGYAETIFCPAAKTLFGKEIEGPIDFQILWNSDFRELSLEVEGETV